MPDASFSSRVSIARLVLVPSVITLAVTILRLVGELQHWSKFWFNPAPGGGAAIIGIVWLVPIFGIYFAWKLAGADDRPASLGKAIGFVIAGFLVMIGGGALAAAAQFQSMAKLVGALLLMGAATALPFLGWPNLTKALLTYGYAARIPVAVIMFFAIRGSWGTHYDGPPPNFPEMGFLQKWVMIGLLPQLVLWVAFTVLVGALFGTIAVAVGRRQKPVAQATS